MKTFLTLIFLSTALVVPSAAQAQDIDELDDLDPKVKTKKKKKKKAKKKAKARRSVAESEIVREIERGYYAKTTVGATVYLLSLSRVMKTGTALSLSIGNDFVDTESSSMAWELSLYQGVHNGMNYAQQGDYLADGVISPSELTQGDSRTIGAFANYEYSAYPARRLGLGLRVGGGVMVVPLLMQRDAYDIQVVAGEWNQYVSTVHSQVHPIFFGGPTLEYYTKLSHFSVGLDVDVSYAIGMDLGLSPMGYMKYSF